MQSGPTTPVLSHNLRAILTNPELKGAKTQEAIDLLKREGLLIKQLEDKELIVDAIQGKLNLDFYKIINLMLAHPQILAPHILSIRNMDIAIASKDYQIFNTLLKLLKNSHSGLKRVILDRSHSVLKKALDSGNEQIINTLLLLFKKYDNPHLVHDVHYDPKYPYMHSALGRDYEFMLDAMKIAQSTADIIANEFYKRSTENFIQYLDNILINYLGRPNCYLTKVTQLNVPRDNLVINEKLDKISKILVNNNKYHASLAGRQAQVLVKQNFPLYQLDLVKKVCSYLDVNEINSYLQARGQEFDLFHAKSEKPKPSIAAHYKNKKKKG